MRKYDHSVNVIVGSLTLIFIMAGRKSNICVTELKSVLIDKKCELFNSNGKLNVPSHQCWKDVVCKLKKSFMIPKYAYVFVNENRHNILDDLLRDPSNDDFSAETSSSSEHITDENGSSKKSTRSFTITVSSEKWTELYQTDSYYRGLDRATLRKR